jgi:hypothetical protein
MDHLFISRQNYDVVIISNFTVATAVISDDYSDIPRICTKNQFKILLKNIAFKFKKSFIYIYIYIYIYICMCVQLKAAKTSLRISSIGCRLRLMIRRSQVRIIRPPFLVWWNVNEIVEFGFSWQLT